MSTKPDYEIVLGIKWEPVHTPEETERFREWWREHVAPELLRTEHELDILEAERNKPIPLKVVRTLVC